MEERGGFLEQLLTSLPLELLMRTPLPQLLPEETLGTYALEFTRGTMNYYHVMSYGGVHWVCAVAHSLVYRREGSMLELREEKLVPPASSQHTQGWTCTLFLRVGDKELRATESFCKT